MRRARNSSPSSLASVRGSKYLRDFSTGSRIGFGFGDHLGQAIDNVVGPHAFGLGVEVRHDAVPQHGGSHRAHVLTARIVAAMQHGPSFGAEDEVLAGPRAGAPTDVI